MAFLSDKAQDLGLPMELNIFNVPPNQVSVQKMYYVHCRPISSITNDDAPIEISVPSQGSDYIDLKRSRLYLRCKIIKADGTSLDDADTTGIINMPLQSMWSSIATYCNGKLLYNYRSTIITMHTKYTSGCCSPVIKIHANRK